jgi:crossover junction endodeoxyribonuclease RuvC
MSVLLGIDPGSRHTGWGVIDQQGNRQRLLACGTISTTHDDMAPRLGEIYAGIAGVLAEYRPEEVGIEKVFMARNADSALKLGHARGAAITAVVNAGVPVFEYSPRQIKQAVVGRGGAEKQQVAQMVTWLLGLNETPQSDAADALAVAICHAHMRVGLARQAGAGGFKRGRMRR